MTHFLYLKNHKIQHTPGITSKTAYTQRIVPLRHVQWVEYQQEHNILRVKMVDAPHAEEFHAEKGEDPSVVKKVFYDILKELRSSGKVIEW